MNFSNPGYPAGITSASRTPSRDRRSEGAGIILDFRGNYGGSDQLAADMCGFSIRPPRFMKDRNTMTTRRAIHRRRLPKRDRRQSSTSFSSNPIAALWRSFVVLVNPGQKLGRGCPLASRNWPRQGDRLQWHEWLFRNGGRRNSVARRLQHRLSLRQVGGWGRADPTGFKKWGWRCGAGFEGTQNARQRSSPGCGSRCRASVRHHVPIGALMRGHETISSSGRRVKGSE